MGNASSLARKTRTFLGLITAFAFWLMPNNAVAGSGDCVAITEVEAAFGEREFVHEKQVAGLSKPLVSRGRVLVSNNQVVWHTQTPFDVRTTISEEGVTRSIDGGPDRPVRAPFSEPGGAMSASIFASVLSGQWQTLRDVFAISERGPKGTEPGEIVLVPGAGATREFLNRIVASGCHSISQVVLNWSDGSRDLIHLSEPSQTASTETGGP